MYQRKKIRYLDPEQLFLPGRLSWPEGLLTSRLNRCENARGVSRTLPLPFVAQVVFFGRMASFLIRVFREESGYLAVVDGWGTVRSPTLLGVREEAKRLVREIVDGAFPSRSHIEQAGGIEILRLRLEVREESIPT